MCEFLLFFTNRLQIYKPAKGFNCYIHICKTLSSKFIKLQNISRRGLLGNIDEANIKRFTVLWISVCFDVILLLNVYKTRFCKFRKKEIINLRIKLRCIYTHLTANPLTFNKHFPWNLLYMTVMCYHNKRLYNILFLRFRRRL